MANKNQLAISTGRDYAVIVLDGATEYRFHTRDTITSRVLIAIRDSGLAEIAAGDVQQMFQFIGLVAVDVPPSEDVLYDLPITELRRITDFLSAGLRQEDSQMTETAETAESQPV